MTPKIARTAIARVSVVVVLALVVTASGSAGPASAVPVWSAGLTLWPPPDSEPTLNYADGLITTVSAPAGVETAVDRASALAAVEAQSFSPELAPGEPDIALRLVSYNLGPPEPGGTLGLTMDRSLAWVFIYRDSAIDLHGPPTLTQAQRSDIRNKDVCIMFFAVNATTAEMLIYQLCEAGPAK